MLLLVESKQHELLYELILAEKHSIHHLIIDGDCAAIMESMHKERNLSWNLIHIWRQIKFLTTKYKSCGIIIFAGALLITWLII